MCAAQVHGGGVGEGRRSVLLAGRVLGGGGAGVQTGRYGTPVRGNTLFRIRLHLYLCQ